MSIWNNFNDQDAYKFSMAQAVYHNFNNANVEYNFICRSNTKLGFLAPKLIREMEDWHDVKPTDNSVFCLPGMTEDFLEWLLNFRLNPKINIIVNNCDGDLSVRIFGPWLHTIWYEIPILSTISELYFDSLGENGDPLPSVYDKIKLLKENPIRLADFGTRRRRSKANHIKVVETLAHKLNKDIFVGTSNVMLADSLGISAVGTMAHEWISAGQSFFHPLDSQKRMLEIWQKEFNGGFGIALTDTLGIDRFVHDFKGTLAKAYDGIRQDSADPINWIARMLSMYSLSGVDPLTKTMVFSDSLNIPKAQNINSIVNGRSRCLFGIGTNISNDLPNVIPLNIVLKLVKVNGRSVAKLSDVDSKAVCCDPLYLEWLKVNNKKVFT
jgi:nicotinate phosphoribosyltransferase